MYKYSPSSYCDLLKKQVEEEKLPPKEALRLLDEKLGYVLHILSSKEDPARVDLLVKYLKTLNMKRVS